LEIVIGFVGIGSLHSPSVAVARTLPDPLPRAYPRLTSLADALWPEISAFLKNFDIQADALNNRDFDSQEAELGAAGMFHPATLTFMALRLAVNCVD